MQAGSPGGAQLDEPAVAGEGGPSGPLIRAERPEDAGPIAGVTEAAFRDHPFSRQTEPAIVAALRAAGALSLSLVAEIDGAVVGHVAFSPVVMPDGSDGWFGVGPVSVLPERQRQGIGSMLMRAGLWRMRERGARGCVLVGPPEYYGRFGFRNDPGLVHDGVPREVFLALPFGAGAPRGQVTFHPAFAVTA